MQPIKSSWFPSLLSVCNDEQSCAIVCSTFRIFFINSNILVIIDFLRIILTSFIFLPKFYTYKEIVLSVRKLIPKLIFINSLHIGIIRGIPWMLAYASNNYICIQELFCMGTPHLTSSQKSGQENRWWEILECSTPKSLK